MLPRQLVPIVAQHVGWRWAFAVLALGPAAGIAAIRKFVASPPAATVAVTFSGAS
jgi:predicted MFS family arabinose efflux permease